MKKKIICVADDDEDVFKLRQIHRRDEPRLTVQFAHLEFLHRADQHARRENPADARGVDFLAGLQVGLLGKKIQIEQRRRARRRRARP